MAIRVKDLGRAAQKLVNNASAAAGEYAAEAQAAAADWEQKTANAGTTWKAGVSQGGAEQRFTGGVRRAGASKYSQRVSTLGQSRYAEGVAAGQDEWQKNFQPYVAVLQGLTLPPRQPRGSAANAQRSTAVQQALAARRLGTQAAQR